MSTHARAAWRWRGVMVVVAAVLAVLGGLVPRAWAQPGAWSQLVAPARSGAAMVYDSARGVTVLFGDATLVNPDAATWEWTGAEGAAWVRRTSTGPAARRDHAMVYDSARGVTVLFGGTTETGTSGETWEWNGTAWTLRATSGPAPRFGHAMVYDAARHVTVLFGGMTDTARSSETWEWDGSAWTRRLVAGPTARHEHAMAYDAARGVTILFGGWTSNTVLSMNTWQWDGTAWTQLMVGSPSARAEHAMAYDADRQVIVLFGGYANGAPNENGQTWEWNGTGWTQRAVGGEPLPSARYEHAMAYDTARHATVLCGGASFAGGANGETWDWNGTAWTPRVSGGPSTRSRHAMAYDVARRVSVVFGGATGPGGTPNGQTWEWNGTLWAQRMVAGPSPRFGHALAYDAARGVTVLFGGSVGANPVVRNGETWEWDGSAWTQRLVSGPTARLDHALAYDAARGVVVLFGGDTGAGAFSDEIWEWDGSAWAQRAHMDPAPGARAGHGMVYDIARGVMVVFGGATSAFGVNGQTWEWDGAGAGAWTERMVGVRPVDREWHAMAYDAARGVCVIFGGYTGTATLRDTWEWNGGTGIWVQLADAGPARGRWTALAYDAARGMCVFVGLNGSGGVNNVETWGWRRTIPCLSPTIGTHPVAAVVCPGGTARLAVAATGGGEIRYQWRRGGVNVVDAPGHVSGATAATMVITGAAQADVGSYDCRVSNACAGVTSGGAELLLCHADFSCDGTVNSQDFFEFLAAFFSLAPAADFNGDMVIDSQDFFDFLGAFFVGC